MTYFIEYSSETESHNIVQLQTEEQVELFLANNRSYIKEFKIYEATPVSTHPVSQY